MSLHNVSVKIKKEKQLNISFIGGSVTEGYGSTDKSRKSWPVLLCQRLEKEYGIVVNCNNEGIGGTCSYLANFRYDADIAPHAPDLLFIEFAVNDMYHSTPYETVVRNSESLIGKAYRQNPNMDMVYVLTYDLHDETNDYLQLKAHRDVADRYGLLSVKMSEYMYPHCAETGENIQQHYIDYVHPNDHGYETYADIIFDVMKSNICTDSASEEMIPHRFLHSGKGLILDARFLYCDEAEITANTGWEFEKGCFSYMGNRYHGRLKADKPGSSFELRFEGTELGIFYGADVNRGMVSISIDGGEPIVRDGYRWTSNPKEFPIATHLSEGRHHAVFTLLDEKNENSNSNFFEIGVFLVSDKN